MASPQPPVAADVLLEDVQGDILAGGIPKRNEDFLFFNIQNPKDFCRILHLETTLDLFSTGRFVANRRIFIKMAKLQGLPDSLIMAIANISFSANGLIKMQTALPEGSLGLTDAWKENDPAFFGGMEADAGDVDHGLKDRMDQWENEFKGRQIDGLVLIGGSDDRSVKLVTESILTTFGSSISAVKIESGVVRQGKFKDYEHFGFNDGISQPTVENIGLDNTKIPDGSVGERGEKWNTFPQSAFVVQDADGVTRPKWAEHGSFLVFRKLEQHVEAWREALAADAKRRGIDPNLLAAKIIGRWPGGCPVMVNSAIDDKAHSFDNQFDFSGQPRSNEDDAICPAGAHIRKMNPNRGVKHDDHDGGIPDGIMLRRGITYGTDYDDGRGEGSRGLHFVCYQSSIEFGFRFVQMFWANPNEFPIIGAGVDPMIGEQGEDDVSKMFISDDDRKKSGSDFVIRGFNPFVTSRGGEYFFTPTLSALRNTLSTATPSA